MKNVTIETVLEATGGIYFGEKDKEDLNITSVEIDSRKIKPGALFVPIVGNRSDAHDFIPDVFKMGAACTLTEKNLPEELEPYILVESSKQALYDLAKQYRESLDITVVGVSGSVGKTSTREMIAAVLNEGYDVFKTKGNKNNDIGISLMIFEIERDHEIAVLEMGISEFGEMHRLSELVKPDVCVINNIEDCHLESLKDRDGVLRAKTEMFDFMSKDGCIILNGDDDKLSTITEVDGIKPIFFGLNKSNQVVAENIVNQGLDGVEADISFDDSIISVSIPSPGEHMVMNALAAVAVGMYFGMSDRKIKRGIENISAVEGRLNKIATEKITILDDSYNASPASMKAGLKVLKSVENRNVAILGDMLELGSEKILLHQEVGEFAAKSKIQLIICVGELGKSIYDGANKENDGSLKVLYFKNKEELLPKLDDLINTGDVVYIKASNAMKFKEILNHLTS